MSIEVRSLRKAFGDFVEDYYLAHAVYEWNYPRQLLAIRLSEASGEVLAEDSLFSNDYLIRRPLLQALEKETNLHSSDDLPTTKLCDVLAIPLP